MLKLPLQTGIEGVFLAIGLAMLVVSLAAIASAVEIVDQNERRALFAFGEFRAVLEPGLTFVPPFVSRTEPIPMGAQTVEVGFEDILAGDGSRCSVLVRADVRIVDGEAAFTEVGDYQSAVTDLAGSISRDAVRTQEMETMRSEPDRVERRIRDELSAAVEDWGLVVPAVELRLTPRPTEARS